MVADFSIPKGDRVPIVQAVLRDTVGPIDLTTVQSVMFQMRRPGAGNTLKVNGAASVVGAPTNGEVSYNWGATDTDTVGAYVAWFLVTFSGDRTMKAPNPPLSVDVTLGVG
jgi:hypothetical protein